MAYPLDPAAQNAGLAAWFGDGHAAGMPDTWEIALYNGHPVIGGVELASAGGYEWLVVANTSANFPDPVDGVITTPGLTWPDPTGAFSDTATHYVLIDHADGATRWFVGALGQDIYIADAQPGFVTSLAIRWNTEGA